jgi:hypothetical protein
MMANSREISIMEYVRKLESKVLTLQAAQHRKDRKPFWIGVAWGAGIVAPLCWYLLRHGG